MKGITLSVLLSALVVSNVSAIRVEVQPDAFFSMSHLVEEASTVAPVAVSAPWQESMVAAPVIAAAPVVAEETVKTATQEAVKAGLFSRLSDMIKSGFNSMVSATQSGASTIASYMPERAKTVLTNKWFIGSAVGAVALVAAYKYFTKVQATPALVPAVVNPGKDASIEIENANRYVTRHEATLAKLAQTSRGVKNGVNNIRKAQAVSDETRKAKNAKLYAVVHNSYKYVKKAVRANATTQIAQAA